MMELLDLYVVDLRYKRVEWVDGFEGMEAVVRYLKESADRERSFTVIDFGGTIRAVAFFRGDELVMTGGSEVIEQ